MSFIEVAKKRYSARSYQNKQVEQDKIDAIIQAGRIAPTAANKQPNRFLVINDAQYLHKLNKGANTHGAPLAIVVCADKNVAWVRAYDNASMAEVDATIATDHMMLQSADMGLGSCWIAHFDPVVIREELNIPDNFIPVSILAIGYADGAPASPARHTTTRKPLDSMVQYQSYGE